MKIIDIIKQRGQTLFTVKTDTKALEAVSIMDTKKIGALIVLDDKENVAGIISERDVLYKCYNTDIHLKDQVVEKLMTPVEDILIGKMDDTAQDLINIMLYRRIRHIPIIENNKIVAMLAVEDILKMIMDSYEIESRLLREHIKNPFGIHTYGEKDI
jgi:predicted transcriptional regulator